MKNRSLYNEKTFIFILRLENNLYLCNVLDKIRDKQ